MPNWRKSVKYKPALKSSAKIDISINKKQQDFLDRYKSVATIKRMMAATYEEKFADKLF